jgi:branched-chain amino acid transport system permease protein
LIVNRTTFGRLIRAVAQNPLAAKILGIDTNRVIIATILMTATLAAIAGILAGLSYGLVSPLMGVPYAIMGLVAMIVGGIGSLRGAVMGAVLIGLVEALSTTYLGSQARDLSVFVVLMLVLAVKPNGLFNVSTR